jgi:cell division transport system permease protein
MSAFSSAWHHIRRSPFQSLAALFTMTTNFIVLTFFALLLIGISSTLNYFESKPEITIFLKDGLTQESLESFRDEIFAQPEVKELHYISKDEALKIYQEQNKDNPLLLEMVTSSILPASLEISAHTPEGLDKIAQSLVDKEDYVDELVYQRDLVQSIIKWSTIIKKAGLVTVATISLISFFVVLVIIGMKITLKRQEIGVVRLLGGSKFYVVKPFLIEGSFYGFLGALVGWLIAFLITFYFKDQVNHFFGEISFLPAGIQTYFFILAGEILFGLLLGFFGSYLAVKRHLKY